MSFQVETEDGKFFNINLDPGISDAVVEDQINKLIQGQGSAASGPLTPDELQGLRADPGEVFDPFTTPTPFRETTGTEKVAGVAIPTATSVAGGMIGGALAGPPGAVLGEAAGDITGLFINVAQGIEPLTLTNLAAAAFTPLVSRKLAQEGVNLTRGTISKTKAARLAVQEANKNQARTIKQNFKLLQESFERSAPGGKAEEFLVEGLPPGSVLGTATGTSGPNLANVGDTIPIVSQRARKAQKRALIQASEETEQRAKNLINFQAKETTESFANAKKRALPVMTDDAVTELYEELNSLAPGMVPLAEFQRAQVSLANSIKGIKEVLPGANTKALDTLAELSKKKIVSFKNVRAALTELSGIQADLAVRGEGKNRFAVGQLRTALEKSLEDAAKSNAIAPIARDKLKKANLANFRLRTSDELSYFLAGHTDHTTGIIDFEGALNSFRNIRNKEAKLLRDRLNSMGLLGSTDKFLNQGRQINLRAKELHDIAKDNLKEARRLPTNITTNFPEQPSLTQFTDPTDPITKPQPSVVFWTVLGLTSFGGAFGASKDPLFAGVTGTGTAGMMALPWSISRMMMTPSSQNFILGLLDSSKGVFDRKIAGATGAFLRASMVQAFASPEDDQGQQVPLPETP